MENVASPLWATKTRPQRHVQGCGSWAKVAYAKGETTVTVEHLEDVDDLVMGHEDAKRVAEAIAEADGTMRRAV